MRNDRIPYEWASEWFTHILCIFRCEWNETTPYTLGANGENELYRRACCCGEEGSTNDTITWINRTSTQNKKKKKFHKQTKSSCKHSINFTTIVPTFTCYPSDTTNRKLQHLLTFWNTSSACIPFTLYALTQHKQMTFQIHWYWC